MLIVQKINYACGISDMKSKFITDALCVLLLLIMSAINGCTVSENLSFVSKLEREMQMRAEGKIPASEERADNVLFDFRNFDPEKRAKLSRFNEQCSLNEPDGCTELAAYCLELRYSLVKDDFLNYPDYVSVKFALQDKAMAASYLSCHVAQNAEGCMIFGQLVDEGMISFIKDIKAERTAVGALKKSCALGSLKGCKAVLAYQEKRGIQMDLEVLGTACFDLKDAKSCALLSRAYADPLKGEIEPEKALQAAKFGCNLNAQSCGALAELYASGAGVTGSERKAVYCHDRACRAGSASDCAQLGRHYAGTDKQKSRNYYKKACELEQDPGEKSWLCTKAED